MERRGQGTKEMEGDESIALCTTGSIEGSEEKGLQETKILQRGMTEYRTGR